MNKQIFLLLPVIIFFITSCKPEYVRTEEELQAFVLDEKNELLQKRHVNGYDLQMIYRPTDLLILQETGGETAVEPEELKRLVNKYKGQYYFILSLSKDNKEALYKMGAGYDHFSDMVQKLSFGMHEHINLTTSGADTIYVADYVFPRTYGMGSSTNILFAFDKEKAIGDEWVQFNISEFGMGLGRQTFRFSTQDLKDIPSVQYTIQDK